MFSKSVVALYLIVLCSAWIQIDKAEGANILGLFSTFSKSHFIIQEALMRGLAAKGHNVTVVSSFAPSKKNPDNYHEIYIDLEEDIEIRNTFNNMLQKPGETSTNPLMMMPTLIAATNKRGVDMLYHAKMQELLKSGQKFDMMVFGWFLNDFLLGVGAHFECPIAVMITVHPIKQLRDMVGNPSSVSSVPFIAHSQSDKPMTFWRRVVEFLFYTVEFIMTNLINYFVFEPYYNEHFPASKYPSFSEIKQNVSLVLVNTHFSQGKPRPYLPNMVEIGGIQIKDKPDPLPKALQEFLDKATDGAILFSLGTNAKVSEMNEQKRFYIFSALEKLKQRVVMKWESDDMPSGLPANILLQKWLPQGDILAHPNTKLFISHCGLSSVLEAKYHAVPILAIPLFAEQFENANLVVEEGWGIIISYADVTADSLSAAVNEILSNPSYKAVVKEKSQRYRDRPLSALDTAVFWIEYVIRHKGARHLKSDAAYMNILQKNSFDVIAFLVVGLVGTWKLMKYFCILVLWNLRRVPFAEKAKNE